MSKSENCIKIMYALINTDMRLKVHIYSTNTIIITKLLRKE